MTTSAKSSYLFIFITKMHDICFFIFSIISFVSSIISAESIAFESCHHKFTCMFFTSSSNLSQTSIFKHQYQKSHRKSYFIINDLIEMFVEKSNKKSKNIIQKNLCFSNFFKFCQNHKLVNQSEFKNSNSNIS